MLEESRAVVDARDELRQQGNMSTPLPTYLRTFRKRSGYTQDELSFLFGMASDQAVSRLERRRAEPSARILIAGEVIFGARPQDLFPAFCNEVRSDVFERAAILRGLLLRKRASAVRDRKLAALALVAGADVLRDV